MHCFFVNKYNFKNKYTLKSLPLETGTGFLKIFLLGLANYIHSSRIITNQYRYHKKEKLQRSERYNLFARIVKKVDTVIKGLRLAFFLDLNIRIVNRLARKQPL